MKTIFKKSLVALALTGAALSVQAADVTFGTTAGKTFGYEGLTTATGTNVNVTLGTTSTTVAPRFVLPSVHAQYAVIRIQFNVPFTTGSSAPVHATTITTTGGKTLRLANSGADFVVYSVDSAAGLAAGDDFALATAKFPAATIASTGSIKVTVSSEEVNGTARDSKKDVVLAEVVKVNEFKITQKIEGTVDVAQGRVVLLDQENLATSVTDNTPVDAFTVAYKTVKGSIKGDFSWVKDQDSKTDGIQYGSVLTTGTCTAGDLTATELEFSCLAGEEVGLTANIAANKAAEPNANVATVLPATKFTLTATSDFSNPVGLASNSVKVFSDADAGEWKLNGSNVLIPYMVYGTVGGKAYNQVIQLTNNSTVEGAIYVDIFDGEGKQIAKNQKLTAVAKANSVVNVGTEIKALVAAAKYEGKVSVRVVAEIPSTSTEVYAAYQDVATSERAIVVGLTTKAN